MWMAPQPKALGISLFICLIFIHDNEEHFKRIDTMIIYIQCPECYILRMSFIFSK